MSKAGKIRDVSFVHDRITKRFRGLAYVEFYEEESIKRAIELSGTVLGGVPIIVELTETEKNRQAKESSSLATTSSAKPLESELKNPVRSTQRDDIKDVDPRRISTKRDIIKVAVTNVSKDVVESDLRRIVRHIASGNVEIRHSSSSDSWYLLLERLSDAEEAIKCIHGTRLLGTKLVAKIKNESNYKSDLTSTEPENIKIIDTIDELDEEERALRAKRAKVLMEMSLPRALCLSNMYSPSNETGSRWKDEIAEEVRSEAEKLGEIERIHVPGTPDGAVYLLFKHAETAGKVASAFGGRWFGGMQISANVMTVGELNLKYPLS